MISIEHIENIHEVINNNINLFINMKKINTDLEINIINNIINLIENYLEYFISEKKITYITNSNKINLPFKPFGNIIHVVKICNDNKVNMEYILENNQIIINDAYFQPNSNIYKYIYEINFNSGYNFIHFIKSFPLMILIIEDLYIQYNYNKYHIPDYLQCILNNIKKILF